MNYQFDRDELETLQFFIENCGIQEAFRVVNHLREEDTIPVDDVDDFRLQFKYQYKEQFGV